MAPSDNIDQKLDLLAKQPFRAKFHLAAKDKDIIAEKGMEIIRQHAFDLISKRLAPAFPSNDGKQTPFRGHPVFVAQHATATCCRSCLLKWHGIAIGKELSEPEQAYVVDVMQSWWERELFLI